MPTRAGRGTDVPPLASFFFPDFPFPFLYHPVHHVAMAAHSAAKAINTQEITDKARRELLLLLESVST